MAVSTQAATLGLERSPRLKKPWMQGRWYSSKYVCRSQSDRCVVSSSVLAEELEKGPCEGS